MATVTPLVHENYLSESGLTVVSTGCGERYRLSLIDSTGKTRLGPCPSLDFWTFLDTWVQERRGLIHGFFPCPGASPRSRLLKGVESRWGKPEERLVRRAGEWVKADA